MGKSLAEKKLIMVVDDDEDLLYLLATQLEQIGYKVHQCLGGFHLIEDAARYKPRLILLDIAMQTVDGAQLCKDLRQDSRFKDVIILMMSGNHNVAEHAIACGANGYVPKPLSLKILKEAVNKYL